MDPSESGWLIALAGAGVVGGLFLMVRGMLDYRSSLQVADTSSSAIGSLAAGEVRISGIIEIAETTIISAIERVPCVYFRATASEGFGPLSPDAGKTREGWIGFRVRDATGSIRVFPRGARIDAPEHRSTDLSFGGIPSPPVVSTTTIGSTTVTTSEQTIGPWTAESDPSLQPGGQAAWMMTSGGSTSETYHETRLEPGDAVTIVGQALPFSDLPDPASADAGYGSDPLLDDPEVAADMAAAVASGTLADDPAEAWGNAAIPGFGIGRPVRAPVIDPAAHPEPIAGAAEEAQAERRFEIAPDTLVLAASDDVPLLIAYGTPGQVVARSEGRFLLGLLGAVLAIGSAMALAIVVSGGF